jgi:hypothetical protein
MIVETPVAGMTELINQLESLVSDRRKFLRTGRVGIDAEEFLALLDQLRNAVPVEFSQARRVIQERQQIILDAQVEAEKIVGAARDKAEYMLSERGLTEEARQRSEHYLRDGRENSRRLMTKVDEYALRVFDEVESVMRVKLEEVQTVMREKLDDLEHAKSTLAQQH